MKVPGVVEVAKKKAEKPEVPKGAPKRYGTLIRVSDEFADAIGEITGLQRISAAHWLDTHVLAMIRKQYRDEILNKAKRLEGTDS